MNLGYACINMTLGESTPRVLTSRGMRRSTFDERGLAYVSELIIQNLEDLIRVIKWNGDNGISLYRMSSDIFPWQSEYKFEDLPNIDTIHMLLKAAGDLAGSLGQRLTFHPGQFNVLASPNPDVVRNTLYELNQHSAIMDMMGLPPTPYSKINIHIGGAYGDKGSALTRWIHNFNKLNANTQARLTVENDDKSSCYSVSDLMRVHHECGIPIVFDYHHHMCYGDPMPEGIALHLAASTWPKDIRQVVHVSESRSESQFRSHHDYVRTPIRTYGLDLDVMLEAKAKELALLEYRELLKSI